MKETKILSVFLIILSHLTDLISGQTYCNSCTFPRVLGGSLADTIIQAIDYDVNENLLISGISYDEGLVGTI